VKVEHEITINRPVADVFAYVTDPANLQSWQDSLKTIERPDDGPVRLGSRWTEKRTMMNRDTDASVEVVELQPDTRFTIESVSGQVQMRVEHDFASAGTGTKLRVAGESKAGGMMKLAGPMVKRQIKQMVEADLGRLKQVLES
jgi:uncharacterized membrane protein